MQLAPHPPAPSLKKGRRGDRFKVPLPLLGEGFRVRVTQMGCSQFKVPLPLLGEGFRVRENLTH
jgi:hypothetical protein